MTNDERIKIYEDTIIILKKQNYSELRKAIVYEGSHVFTFPISSFNTRIIVEDIDSFEAIEKFGLEENRRCVLNFANAYLPGGGVLKGFSAQEEDLCRRSSLHLSLTSDEAEIFYLNNKACPNLFNDNSIILSPNVLVLKDGKYDLLVNPYNTAVVTMPAPNLMSKQAEGLKKDLQALYYDEFEREEFLIDLKARMSNVMKGKMRRVLSCMLGNGYFDIVLGAWGAGAFGHNAYNIAKLFKSIISEEFEGCFRTVVFAVLDNTKEKVKVRAFEDVFKKNI